MDPGVAIGIGVLWVVFNLITRKNKPAGPTRRPAPPRSQTQAPGRLPPSAGTDPTQREGARLQDLLRELGRTLDGAAGPRGRPAATRLPPAEEVEDRTSLETPVVVRSLEAEVRRPQRLEVDSDDEAEAVIARRRAAAEAHGRPLGSADYLAFEARIRQEPADATATQAYTMARLRNAIVWREILGPPVSLRGPEDQ